MLSLPLFVTHTNKHISLPLHKITPDSLHGIRALGSLIQAHRLRVCCVQAQVHEEPVDHFSNNLHSLYHKEEEEIQHEH